MVHKPIFFNLLFTCGKKKAMDNIEVIFLTILSLMFNFLHKNPSQFLFFQQNIIHFGILPTLMNS